MDHLRIDVEYSVMWLDALADVEFPGWGESAPTVRMRRGESIRLVYATKEEFDREPWYLRRDKHCAAHLKPLVFVFFAIRMIPQNSCEEGVFGTLLFADKTITRISSAADRILAVILFYSTTCQ